MSEENIEGGIYSKEEVLALKGIFSLYDSENVGGVKVSQLEGILQKIGHNADEIDRILEGADAIARDGRVSFDDFIHLLEESGPAGPIEGPDPKVMEFLRILEEYRMKCEEEGNYLEAGRAHKQLEVLRKQEIKRQQKAVRARQLGERQDVQVAHNMQFQDFNTAWDKYLEEYDRMAQIYIQQMTERHAVNLLEYQQKLQRDIMDKAPKWSKELLEWRRRQHILARQRNYAEAQKVKKIADQLEEEEKTNMHETHSVHLARKEAAFRAQQQAELHALLKRVDARRKEHIKQRNLDSKRLLQRNRNVQSVLEAKQAVESQKLSTEIKKSVLESLGTTSMAGTIGGSTIPLEARASRGGKKIASKKKGGAAGGTDGDKTFVTNQAV